MLTQKLQGKVSRGDSHIRANCVWYDHDDKM